jgi:hypothetical protein
MGFQPSASKAGLLLRCSRPFSPDVEVPRGEPTEAMRYGSCIHALVEGRVKGSPSQEVEAATCAKWGVRDVTSAQIHAGAALKKLGEWCRGDNPLGIVFRVMFSELPLATKIAGAWSTRVCDFEPEEHRYDLRDGEVGGTFDLLLRSEDGMTMVVVDLKTGSYGDWTRPEVLPQMQSLVMQARVRPQWRAPHWYAAILHSQADLPPAMYLSEEIKAEDSKRHLTAIRVPFGRIGDGSLTPGEWCFLCPAREGCPANDGAMLARSGALVKMSTAELMKEAVDPGALHMFLQQFEALAKRARSALRAEVERGALVIRPDGKTLVLKEKTIESLSKASIIRALGKEEGEKVIQDLRDRGVVETSTHLEVRAVEDK